MSPYRPKGLANGERTAQILKSLPKRAIFVNFAKYGKRQTVQECAKLVNCAQMRTIGNLAEICERENQAPAQPGRRNERPQRGRRKQTGPPTGTGEAPAPRAVIQRRSAAQPRGAKPRGPIVPHKFRFRSFATSDPSRAAARPRARPARGRPGKFLCGTIDVLNIGTYFQGRC